MEHVRSRGKERKNTGFQEHVGMIAYTCLFLLFFLLVDWSDDIIYTWGSSFIFY